MCRWVLAQFRICGFIFGYDDYILTRNRLLEAAGKDHCVEGNICHPMEKKNRWKI
jgi:hypothetical protein